MNEDQYVDGVGVMQPTCTIIRDECVRESKEEPIVKDDSLLAMPPLVHLDIPCDSTIDGFPSKSPFLDVSISDHSQGMSDVSLSLQCREDTSSPGNSFNLSSIIIENIEGENLCFSCTPLPDSSNHEDTGKHPEFSDLGFHDLFTSSYDCDVDSINVNLSKALVYDDLSVNEVKTPQTIEALQPELMVMLGPHCPEVGFTSG